MELEYDHMTQSFAIVSYIAVGFTVSKISCARKQIEVQILNGDQDRVLLIEDMQPVLVSTSEELSINERNMQQNILML